MPTSVERRRATDRERQRRWVEANRDRRRERDRAAYAADPKAKRRVKEASDRLRAEVYAAYGTSCKCCGSLSRLSIDHINGDGSAHRDELFGPRRGAGVPFYRWLKANGFPAGFQTLCVPCNTSKGSGDRCAIQHGDTDADSAAG